MSADGSDAEQLGQRIERQPEAEKVVACWKRAHDSSAPRNAPLSPAAIAAASGAVPRADAGPLNGAGILVHCTRLGLVRRRCRLSRHPLQARASAMRLHWTGSGRRSFRVIVRASDGAVDYVGILFGPVQAQ